MYAAAPEPWGQDIHVPEIILYDNALLSKLTLEIGKIGEIGDHAARMSTPGAAKSG